MKYVDEFRDKGLTERIAKKISKISFGRKTYRIMEVCGTHTMSIMRHGLKNILPDNIQLISGPGCPVCVTPNRYLDTAIAIAGIKNVIITTFGDIFRVPGSYSSMERERAKGRSIRVVYSTTDALDMAKRNKGSEVVFLGIGFETTAPTVATSILEAKKRGINNYSVLCGHKTMPEVLEYLLKGSAADLYGFLLPGHVSAIIGTSPYKFISAKYGKRCVITGFEPVDIMESVYLLLKQKRPSIDVGYRRVINPAGNKIAQEVMKQVFKNTPSEWRGIGTVDGSGLSIRKEYYEFDAMKKFRVKIKPPRQEKGCICGSVLAGIKEPIDCGLFSVRCTPEHPVGACMVSTEGACAAYYKFRNVCV